MIALAMGLGLVVAVCFATIRNQRHDIANLRKALRAQSAMIERMSAYLTRRTERETRNARVLRDASNVIGWPRSARPRLH